MRLSHLWFLSFSFVILSLTAVQPVRSQRYVPPSQNPDRPSNSGNGFNPLIILDLIRAY